jgi:hypothetical protein
VKRPKFIPGVWENESAYFPNLDGASVMTFEARDLGGAIRFEATAENALAWTLFLCLHTDLRGELEPVTN